MPDGPQLIDVQRWRAMPALQETLSVLHCSTTVHPLPITYVHEVKRCTFSARL
jgi:hypothetical protein